MFSSIFKKWDVEQVWQAINLWIQGENTESHSIDSGLLSKHAIRLLCVDDDTDFCDYMRSFADAMHMTFFEAHSVSEAKEQILSYPFHVFIIDGHLPDGSGIDLIAWVRKEQAIMCPIVFISRIYHDATSFRVLKEKLNVEYVLDKPIKDQDVKELFNCLATSCGNESELENPPEDFLAEIKKNYNKSIYDKIDRLEKMILDVQKQPTLENLQLFKTEVHKIAGSSGSYGFTKVSELCKQCEIEIEQRMQEVKNQQLDINWLNSLDEFFAQVKKYFQLPSKKNEENSQKKTQD